MTLSSFRLLLCFERYSFKLITGVEVFGTDILSFLKSNPADGKLFSESILFLIFILLRV